MKNDHKYPFYLAGLAVVHESFFINEIMEINLFFLAYTSYGKIVFRVIFFY